MTADLVSFLRARLDEDEASALACIAEVGPERTGEMYDDQSGTADRDAFPSYPWGSEENELTYMAGIGHPARVLREVEAKRRIVAEHGPTIAEYIGPEPLDICRVCSDEYAVGISLPCPTLRLLALPYSDHPDYRAEEWKP